MKIASLFLHCVVLTVFGVACFSSNSRASEDELPVYRISDEMLYEKLLLIRRLSSNGHLLLKILNENRVFLYDIEKRSVTKVDEGVWHNSTEEVSVCDNTGSTNDTNEKSFNTDAKYALAVTVSPSNSKLAIYTAEGPKTRGISLFPGLGGGNVYHGGRYLEIKQKAGNQNIGKPVRVRDTGGPGMCWTKDENLVVLYDIYTYSFSVLDLDPEQHSPILPNLAERRPAKPDLSRFTGVINDYGVDENGDGLFEKVAVEIETETTISASYRMNISLRSKGGKSYPEGKEIELNGGLERTKFLFDTKSWFESQQVGSFEVSLADLYYKLGPSIDQRANLGRTKEYKLSQFQRPNIVFTGENFVTPIDRDKNGKFESLRIEVGVDTLYPGNYEFQGDLYDEISESTAEGLIEFGAGKASLGKGRGAITFSFSGTNIIKHGKSGRYRLRFVVISKPRNNAPFSDVLLTTQPFDISQFEAVD